MKPERKSDKVQYHGVGGRKTSIARVWLTLGSGRITVNGKKLDDYVCRRPILMFQAVQPFVITNTSNRYDVKANVHGGGVSSQVGAIRNAIAKALLEVSPDLRPPLRRTGMLTRDSRIKERKKYGHKRARKSFQFSKR
ncbi:30S ribosomal protein S9 [Candidatus Margulisiibacteriota bacterium]